MHKVLSAYTHAYIHTRIHTHRIQQLAHTRTSRTTARIQMICLSTLMTSCSEWTMSRALAEWCTSPQQPRKDLKSWSMRFRTHIQACCMEALSGAVQMWKEAPGRDPCIGDSSTCMYVHGTHSIGYSCMCMYVHLHTYARTYIYSHTSVLHGGAWVGVLEPRGCKAQPKGPCAGGMYVHVVPTI